MNNIIIIGIVNNHHTLYGYLLNELKKQADDLLFITNSSIDQAITYNSSKIRVIIDDSNRPDKILKKHLPLINQNDVLIVDEYYGYYLQLLSVKLKTKKMILILHNINKWISIPLSSFNGLKGVVLQLLKRMLLAKFDAYIVVSPNVQRYLKNKQEQKPVFFVPFDFTPMAENESQNSNNIIITIPGMITEKRKNFNELLPIIEKHYKNHPTSSIKFKFLGKISSLKGENIRQYADKINTKYGNKIKYWTRFVDKSEFELEISTSDYVMSNIHKYSFKEGVKEYMGISKETGVSYIIYRYCKPGIVPDYQSVLSGFNTQLIRYSSLNDLLNIFSGIEVDRYQISTLKEEARNNQLQFDELVKKETSIFIKYINSNL